MVKLGNQSVKKNFAFIWVVKVAAVAGIFSENTKKTAFSPGIDRPASSPPLFFLRGRRIMPILARLSAYSALMPANQNPDHHPLSWRAS